MHDTQPAMVSKRVVFTLYFIIVSCSNNDDVSLCKRESFLPSSLLIIHGKFTQKSYRKTFTIQLHSLPTGITNGLYCLRPTLFETFNIILVAVIKYYRPLS